jgi:hypothetical protein
LYATNAAAPATTPRIGSIFFIMVTTFFSSIVSQKV